MAGKRKSSKIKITEFFRLKVWKIILTLIAAVIAYVYLGPAEIWTINDFTGPTTVHEYAPIGIENPYVFLLFSLILFYLFFSLIELIITKIRRYK